MVENIILNDSQFETFFHSIDPPLSKEDFELQQSSFQKLKKERYLFCWDKIPEKHNEYLIDFLKERFSIDFIGIPRSSAAVGTNYGQCNLNSLSHEMPHSSAVGSFTG
jgi:hypothetical protein